jgi:hypothetical protein
MAKRLKLITIITPGTNHMKNFKRSIAALAVATTLGMSASAYAGNNDGVLKGLVLDSTNSVLSGATVTIKNPKTGFKRTVTADSEGNYRFPSLPIGTYTVTTMKNGYTSEVVENVRVQIGETNVTSTMFADGVERITVSGNSISMVDTSSSGSEMNIGAVELSRIPVARNSTDVALLAPGTTRGDDRFGNLASFGGASVAENAYFINGLNVTNFRNGLGGSTVPFEFYKEFQVKSGGYSAEFGRSTGGVINAVTKSGSNEWEYGANLYYTPDIGDKSQNSLDPREGRSPLAWNSENLYNKLDANIYLSGPIIEDKLFFYVLYNPRNIESEYVSTATDSFYSDSQDDAFWGTKIDWNITDDHILELTAFSDERTTTSEFAAYDYDTGDKGEYGDPALSNRGGSNVSLKYTGYITDDFTISALWGKNEADLTDSSPSDLTCPLIIDVRTNGTASGCWSNSVPAAGNDSREAFRLDGEYVLDDHTIRFGLDYETNTSIDSSFYSGHIYYRYITVDAGEDYEGTSFPNGADVVRIREYETGGEFETLSNAIYIEDTWSITDDITASIGLRSESFNNKNAEGESFIKVDNQIAPRLGIAWDINGDGESKVYANWGRYHLPIAANTNIRMAGAELFTEDYYVLDGLNADDTPIYDPASLFSDNVYSDGTVPDVAEVLDSSIEPMYQDEFILGYQFMLNDEWALGIKGTYRDLASIIDDVTIDKAIIANDWEYHGNTYVLTNPGTDITTWYDTDGDGEIEQVSIDASDLGYPEPERTYTSVELSFDRAWDDVWSISGSYVWSESKGNAEGYVKSDNGQDDAGLTTDWDFPQLMDGANGLLPNDRTHTFKVYGSYQLTEELRLGANFTMQSGRPKNKFGYSYPSEYDLWEEVGYGNTYYQADGEFNSRGSQGRLDSTYQIDLNATYEMEISGADVSFAVDVFNVLNSDTVTRIDEIGESSMNGSASPTYGLPLEYQSPRSVQFSASVRF